MFCAVYNSSRLSIDLDKIRMNFKGLIVIIHPFVSWRTFLQLIIPSGRTRRNIDWIKNFKETQSCKVRLDFHFLFTPSNMLLVPVHRPGWRETIKQSFLSQETTRRLNLNPDLLIEMLTARTTSLHLTQPQVKQSYSLASSIFRHIKVCTQIINEIQFLTIFYKLASILPRPQNIPPWPLSRAWVTSSELRDWPGHQARQRSTDPVLWGVQSLDLERFHVEPSHWAACGAD